MFLMITCMSLVYFQGLGLIANDSTATAAETGAFMNHTPPVFLYGCTLTFKDFSLDFDSCAFSSPGFLTNPNSYPVWACLCCAVLWYPPDWPFSLYKMVMLSVETETFQLLCVLMISIYFLPLLYICSCRLCLEIFLILSILHSNPPSPQSKFAYFLIVQTWCILYWHMCVCVSSIPGYHGSAGGPGVWALAVIFLISIIATGSFILYKFKRWGSCWRACQSVQKDKAGIK